MGILLSKLWNLFGTEGSYINWNIGFDINSSVYLLISWFKIKIIHGTFIFNGLYFKYFETFIYVVI